MGCFLRPAVSSLVRLPLTRMRRLAMIAGVLLLVSGVSLWAGTEPEEQGIKTIYIIPTSHYDLGFLAPPEEILTHMKRHIDEVIANAQADPEFRWTVEATWHVKEWLKRTTDRKQIEAFAELVRSGQIQVSVTFGSMHTEFMGVEGLNRIAYDWKRIAKDLGIQSNLAMMNDVPGFTLRLPQVLARSGVRYFLNGSNLFIGGGTALYPGQMPFWWQAPDGSRVLVWQTQGKRGGYTEAIAEYYLDPRARDPYFGTHFYPKEWEGLPNVEIQRRGVDKMLARFAEADYPYDAVLMFYSHDFVSSDWVLDYLFPSVREWNAAGEEPRMVVATPAEFFGYLEGEYGQDFPVYQGDWTGLWSEVKINSPGISATARWLHHHLVAAEMIWSILSLREGGSQHDLSTDELHGVWFSNLSFFPQGNFDEDYYRLFKYEEHSASGQTGWPLLMTRDQIDQQNSQYVGYVSTSRTDVEHLIKTGLKSLGSERVEANGTPGLTLFVFNPLGWLRTDMVQLDLPVGQGILVRDQVSGEEVPVQRLSAEKVEFLAKNVPSLGYKTYWIEVQEETNLPGGSTESGSTTVENDFYRIEVRPRDGALVSIRDKTIDRELVNQSASRAFNELSRWSLSTTERFLAKENLLMLGTPQFELERGPVATRLTVKRPGSLWPETQISLYEGIKRVEIMNRLDREQMPFVPHNRQADYYSFLFPFNFSNRPTLRLDNGAGFHRFPADYLPGARMDAVVPQHALVLTGDGNKTPIQIVLSQRETFFNHIPQVPGMEPGELFENTVRAAVLRKNDQGATKDMGTVYFPTVEPGLNFPDRYHYGLTSEAGKFNAVSASRAGWELNMPLLAVALPPSAVPNQPQMSFWSVSADNVEILAFKPSADGEPGHYTLRLQEISGRNVEAELQTPFLVTRAEKVSLTEDGHGESLSSQPLRVPIKPFETVTLRLALSYPPEE